jgi:hypothetical protein
LERTCYLLLLLDGKSIMLSICMSRLKKFSASLWTGQVLLGVNVLYTMLSIPLALHYLARAEFGVWMVVVQLTGYLVLIDAGMTSAFVRMLIDHKDDRSNGKYGAMIKLSLVISSAQGVGIFLVGLGFSYVAAALLNIPPELQQKFRWLLAGQCALTMVTFCLRVWGNILYAYQRMDVANWVGVAYLSVSLALLVLFFALGAGIYAILYANVAALVLCGWVPLWICCRAGYLPRRHEFGKINWELAREPIKYGTDYFLIVLGNQLMTASQTLLVTCVMGVEAAAVWVVMTKPFGFISRIAWRILDYAPPALCEMCARGETARFQQAYRDIVVLTGYLAAAGAAGLVVCNSDFVRIWTGGKMEWAWHNDLLLGVWFLLYSVYRCHCSVPSITKQFHGLQYVYLSEGFVFICAVLGLGWLGWMGFWLVLSLSIITNTLFTGFYGIARVAEQWHISRWQLAGWSGGMAAAFVILTGLGLLAHCALQEAGAIWQLAGCVLLIGGLGAIFMVKYGISPERAGQLPPLVRRFLPGNR